MNPIIEVPVEPGFLYTLWVLIVLMSAVFGAPLVIATIVATYAQKATPPKEPRYRRNLRLFQMASVSFLVSVIPLNLWAYGAGEEVGKQAYATWTEAATEAGVSPHGLTSRQVAIRLENPKKPHKGDFIVEPIDGKGASFQLKDSIKLDDYNATWNAIEAGQVPAGGHTFVWTKKDHSVLIGLLLFFSFIFIGLRSRRSYLRPFTAILAALFSVIFYINLPASHPWATDGNKFKLELEKLGLPAEDKELARLRISFQGEVSQTNKWLAIAKGSEITVYRKKDLYGQDEVPQLPKDEVPAAAILDKIDHTHTKEFISWTGAQKDSSSSSSLSSSLR